MANDIIARGISQKNKQDILALTQQGVIKGILIKTQAEYDALPSSKTTDGIIYLIRG